MDIKNDIICIVLDIAKVSMNDTLDFSNMNLANDLGYDSLMIIELIVTLEEKYGFEINFDDLDLEKIYDLAVLIEIVKNNMEESIQ